MLMESASPPPTLPHRSWCFHTPPSSPLPVVFPKLAYSVLGQAAEETELYPGRGEDLDLLSPTSIGVIFPAVVLCASHAPFISSALINNLICHFSFLS